MIILFSTQACAACAEIKLFLPGLAASRGINMRLVDPTIDRVTAATYHVQSVPTIVWTGPPVRTTTRATTPAAVAAWLEECANA